MSQGLLYEVQPGEGGGSTQQFLYWEAPPRGPTPLFLHIQFLTKKVPLSYWQIVPLSLDFLKVRCFSFPVPVVGPSAKVELSLSRSLLPQKHNKIYFSCFALVKILCSTCKSTLSHTNRGLFCKACATADLSKSTRPVTATVLHTHGNQKLAWDWNGSRNLGKTFVVQNKKKICWFKVETDALNEVKEQVSQRCLTRTWLLVVVWRSTRVLIPL